MNTRFFSSPSHNFLSKTCHESSTVYNVFFLFEFHEKLVNPFATDSLLCHVIFLPFSLVTPVGGASVFFHLLFRNRWQLLLFIGDFIVFFYFLSLPLSPFLSPILLLSRPLTPSVSPYLSHPLSPLSFSLSLSLFPPPSLSSPLPPSLPSPLPPSLSLFTGLA